MHVLLVIAAFLACAHGHGRIAYPPNRASLWRFGYNSPANYDDDGLNCGGFYHQWSVNGGKCGICGDPYDSAQPRAHEIGGKYGVGYIVSTYTSGQVFPITTYLSASHLGYWEYRICPDPNNNNQECFDDYLLELEEGGTKYYPLRGSGTYQSNYRLPAGLECEHCVLQWKYVAGNNWGVCTDGSQGLGCGNQEHFFSCTDIEITGTGSNDGNGDSNGDGNDDSTGNEIPDDDNDVDNDIPDDGNDNDVDNDIPDDGNDDNDDDYVPVESPYVPVEVPVIHLTGEGEEKKE